MSKNLGIDLGTTNSCLSYLEGRDPLIIPNPEGSRVIPTVISLDSQRQHIFGNIAKRQIESNPGSTIWGIKRLMGRKFDSPEVQTFMSQVGYQIHESANGDTQIQLGDRHKSPEELSGMFLHYLKTIAENYLGDNIGETVITVPAFFNDHQRQSTKTAGQLAGLKVSRIINEPTAALIAYSEKISRDGLYAVYDLGGGTFDISVVEVKGDVYKVVSTLGDTFLGGSDFDRKVLEWIIAGIREELGKDIEPDIQGLQRILQSAEKAKIELSFNEEALISIPYLLHLKDGSSFHFQKKLTRSQLEHSTLDLVEKTLLLVKRSLDEAGIKPDEIEKTILVGGQSRMPIIARKLETFFGKTPFTNLNPEEVVAQGAALQAEIIQGRVRDLLLLDVTPLSLGVEARGDQFEKLIERNTTIPVKKSRVFTTINDNQRTVKIHILQGERILASENRSLGHFNLVGIPLAPKGIPQIEVSFEIDANGIVRVSARDKQTGITQAMKVHPSSGLSPEEIEKIMQESSKSAENDRMTLKLNRLKNDLQEECSALSFFIERNETKIGLILQSEIQSLLNKSRKELEKEDATQLENILQRVKKARQKVNQLLIAEFEK